MLLLHCWCSRLERWRLDCEDGGQARLCWVPDNRGEISDDGVVRLFDPSSPRNVVDAAKSLLKRALDTRRNGLNGN